MARINTLQLIENATNVGLLTDRARQVQRDPAVQKAWREAGADVFQAYRSVASATLETRAAWHRTAATTPVVTRLSA